MIELQRPVTAFVGRALKGPLNRPVPVDSFADFQRLFGGLWQPSTLSYSVEQFFVAGGRRALIVRVANGARAPTLSLPAGAGMLRLIGVHPGSREYLRASVDYDGIVGDEGFNLVIQRVRSTGTERVEDQEIFRRVSLEPGSERFVGDLLLRSELARLVEPLPSQRPDRSGASGGCGVGYTCSTSDGHDGGPLTDYDIIGSASDGTGLFALCNEDFDFLCTPPLTREQDVGLGTLLVAARLCRERHALLIVDSPIHWLNAQDAIESMRTWPFRSDSAVMCYPRVRVFDPLRGREEVFASCGAAAGLLSRAEEVYGYPSTDEGWVLRLGLRPAVDLSEAQRTRLAHAGINSLMAAKAGDGPAVSARTLGAGVCGSPGTHLSARRLALRVAASIKRGTRWVLFEQNNPATWSRARLQVDSYLQTLAGQGAFAGATSAERYFVVCDERINDSSSVAAGRVNLLFGIAARRAGQFDTWLVSHDPSASRARPVSVNRLMTGGARHEALRL